VIEAKRKGVFDYGKLIRDTESGVGWPTDTAAILAHIDKAEKGELDPSDLIPLVGKEIAEGIFSNLTPKLHKKIDNVVETVVEALQKPVVDDGEKRPAHKPKVETVSLQDDVKPKEKPAMLNNEDSAKILHLLEDLIKLVKATNEEIYRVVAGMSREHKHLNNNLFTLNENLHLMGQYMDPGIKLQALEGLSDVVIDTRYVDAETPSVPVVVAATAEELNVVTPPAAAAKAAETEATVTVTEAELKRMDLGALRELGAKLGIKGASTAAYLKPLLAKIRVHLNMPGE
jgi:hypothetical protein